MSTHSGQDDRSQADLLNDLRYGTPQAQEEALARLAAVGEAEALDAVIEYLHEQPPGTCGAGLDALRVLAGKYVPFDRYGLAEVLIPFLTSEDWSQRLSAARLLGTYPNEMATDALRTLVEEARDHIAAESNRLSPSRMVAERTLAESIMALASCGRLMALPDILSLLDERTLRPLATRALGVIGSDTDRPRLEDLAEDDDFRVRDAAQWALGLMDERAEQFTRPPDQIPEPPPDRLTPLYWAHRLLEASDDDLLQFLVVRVAIEHLLLDNLLGEGRLPESCVIVARTYEGDSPPDFRGPVGEAAGVWRYTFQGPTIEPLEAPPAGLPLLPRPGLSAGRVARILISYPDSLPERGDGLVSFDCLFEPMNGRGWIYRIARHAGEYTFRQVRSTWST